MTGYLCFFDAESWNAIRGQLGFIQFPTLDKGVLIIYRVVFFFTGTPPKSSKYKKVNLG